MVDHQELIVTHFFRMVYLRTTSFCFILVIHFFKDGFPIYSSQATLANTLPASANHRTSSSYSHCSLNILFSSGTGKKNNLSTKLLETIQVIFKFFSIDCSNY